MEITPTLATSALEGHSLQVPVCLLLIDAKNHLATGKLGSATTRPSK